MASPRSEPASLLPAVGDRRSARRRYRRAVSL